MYKSPNEGDSLETFQGRLQPFWLHLPSFGFLPNLKEEEGWLVLTSTALQSRLPESCHPL